MATAIVVAPTMRRHRSAILLMSLRPGMFTFVILILQVRDLHPRAQKSELRIAAPFERSEDDENRGAGRRGMERALCLVHLDPTRAVGPSLRRTQLTPV